MIFQLICFISNFHFIDSNCLRDLCCYFDKVWWQLKILFEYFYKLSLGELHLDPFKLPDFKDRAPFTTKTLYNFFCLFAPHTERYTKTIFLIRYSKNRQIFFISLTFRFQSPSSTLTFISICWFFLWSCLLLSLGAHCLRLWSR